MTSAGGAQTIRGFRHTTICESPAGVPFRQAKLTDQQRLGVLLQGAALLAHAGLAGCCLPRGWHDARVGPRGRLQVEPLVPGRPADLTQVALLDLLALCFQTQGPPAGRGEARRIARHLVEQLSQVLTPVAADRVVEEVLDSAPFLWSPAFATARQSLAGEHSGERAPSLWVAGPGEARSRFLLQGPTDYDALLTLLASSQARELWQGEAPEPSAGSNGRPKGHGVVWRRALVGWGQGADAASKLGRARAQVALGRYRQALAELEGARGVEPRLLRTRCQLRLGELHGAMSSIRGLAGADLEGDQRLELAEMTSLVLAARDQRQAIEGWMERLLGEAEVEPWARALVLAGSAWDRGDLAAVEEGLEAAREGALGDPAWAGRWHHLAGQRALQVRDGLAAAEHLEHALGSQRRQMPPARAARLWSDLGVARAYAGDLAGAERACRHAERLLWGAEGPVRTALALYNLAEVRLRRGRVEGVEEVLERATAENRRSGNRKGLIRDLELWVRLDLAQARPTAALTRCAEARQELESGDPEARAGVFEVFAARAHGWLGRAERASACLDLAEADDLAELEDEERPALLALAGRRDEAIEEAANGPWHPLWGALAAGLEPDAVAWGALDALEPYRAARVVFDCEVLQPGIVPPRRLRAAVVALRRSGADGFAERLESRSLGPWRALERYLGAGDDSAAHEPRRSGEADRVGGVAVGRAEELLRSAGYHDARLVWSTPAGERVLLAGEGGGETLRAPWGEGQLQLSSPWVDPVLRALFGLLHRDLEPPVRTSETERPRSRGRGGILGSSPALITALDRLDRLAKSDLPMLVLGESGTGKELVASRAHALSRRAGAQFLAVNCAALAESLVQGDLFGHVRGAFTGADRDRKGFFETAQGGTVFLDEIGDLPLPAQGKLLRVLQEGEVRRLGESFSRKVDVRIVAATHRDLASMVEEETFRQDLYFRLKVATVELPPLRDRGDDILEIAEHLLEKERRLFPDVHLTGEARTALLGHGWPGNVRELENRLKVSCALAEDGAIHPLHLELEGSSKGGEEVGDYHQKVERFRKQMVQQALDRSAGNRAEAARRLGLSRQALSYLVRKFKLG